LRFPKKDIIVPAITLCLSLLNIFKGNVVPGSGSFFVSILGLTAVALYILRVNYSRVAFYLWAGMQLIIIRQEIPQGVGGLLLSSGVLDLSQGFKLALYAPVKIGPSHYEAGINFITLFLIFLNRVIPGCDLNGIKLSFFSYRHDNSLGIIFPVKGTVAKSVTLSNEKDWLLVKLNQAFRYNSMDIEHVLIKRNDKKQIIPGKTNQLVFFKLVPDMNLIREKDNDKEDFPFEVWALCK
jgi:hypothetical protein